ncbi:MAG: bis(5'-nucleosyl)-tetraphosphatase (symmetrical) YqeK [Cyanosarcina radialis HA8281-LM2]|jgi:predicted HD superfamily hydrolase involved in NAD metabolism|nr:bis(5'-nucleosyl)-tetraphosphatase (symmetrical) YqeK [Cyanosarcina radialis HA8281-LM2]
MRQQVLAWLADNVPASRLQHILGVEQMAIALARHYHLDEEKAARAGLMHDLAKYFKPQKLLQMAQAEGLELDPVDIANPHLLHANVSAIVAREQFGIKDEEVLQAIKNHTLGSPGMDLLSCIVFLADSLEPGRGSTTELEKLRQISWQELHKAVWKTCDYSLKYLLDSRCLIHPRTIKTRNWAMEIADRKQSNQVKSQKSKVKNCFLE